ncbi:MAG: thiamine pyrophosphate-requiring protein [Pigmentiphaga sp.]|uniref:thiamine pyrophosphate-requiring protein n=1 Tax=Pigmentiphaga sp. TaxID=1977564 RepID=UPI0029AC94DF|nr:thiamine pyrophosphate-requiring protein [Pigmentiphaga sp.]MDX3904396.1 thiamine pyrophosphate-requiring protein [Pigmentiphaga sp.]
MHTSASSLPPGHDQETVADAYLRALARHRVDWLFCNAGTDFPPLIEAYERARRRDAKVPQPVLVPHENVAVGMAYGAALTTGKPQVVMVHVGIGTANAACGLFNAARQQVPLILTAGRTPVLEGGRLGARNNYINWAQEMFDQGAMVRELVKWDYELRDPSQVDAVVDRAYAASASSPQGPSYLVLPREVLSAPAQPAAMPTFAAPVPAARARQQDIDQLADWLATAKKPLIVTSDIGRSAQAFEALSAFARRWAIPVVQYRPRYGNIPTSHPMFAGYNPSQWVPQADCVLVLESDVPWIPDECRPAPNARIAQVGKDPLYLNYPMRGFPSQLSIAADAHLVLQDLESALAARMEGSEAAIAQRQARVADLTAANRQRQDLPANLNHRYVSRCLAELFDDETVLINEYPFTLEELDVTQPSRFYSHSPAGGLGWGTGMALGIKLAAPQRTVVLTVGDGSYMFGNPSAAHFVARAMGLPILIVVYNNRRWAAVHRATLSMYPDGLAAASEEPPLTCLEPSPDYERLVEASGGLGLRVERVEELREALQQAMQAVRGGRQAVVNILTQASYTRTS